MKRILVTGLKQDLRPVIEELHELELLDIDEYTGEMDTGKTFDEGEEVSQLLVDLRSILSKLPEVEGKSNAQLDFNQVDSKISELNNRINELENSKTELKSELTQLKSRRQFFEELSDLDLEYRDLKGTRTLNCFTGKIDERKFRSEAPNDRYEIMHGESADVVFYPDEQVYENLINSCSEEILDVPEVELNGSISSINKELEQRKNRIESRIEQNESQIEKIAVNWRNQLEEAEKFLTEKVEKAEAPIKFATTDSAFFAEGWIPAENYGLVEEKLAEVTGGKVHVQQEEMEDEPPVKHSNPGPVKHFEDLTDLVSVPRYNELDPSFVLLLTFPLFFGFMIGDAGYGLTSALVFYAGMKMFPDATDIFKSLMYASFATILFGLAFGDAFGYVIFGSHSELAAVTGIQLFEQIPILFHRAEHLGQVFTASALIGLVHVNFGYLLGFYNEHVKHGFRQAFLEKGSWLMLQAGAALWFFVGMTAGLPVMVISVALLYLGEGIEGVVEIPSLLSNILSYLRIFGVSVAAVSLAAVVNGLADPLFQSGSVIGVVLGVVMLVLGHTFNTFIKIIEGFLQGIRLHYVEMFNKFYEGGGRKYVPFGAK